RGPTHDRQRRHVVCHAGHRRRPGRAGCLMTLRLEPHSIEPHSGPPPVASSNGMSNGHGAASGVTSVPAASLFATIAADLTAVDDALRQVAEGDHPLLRQTLRLTLSTTGKRLRPALTLLTARLHENVLERRVELAVAAELLHT